MAKYLIAALLAACLLLGWMYRMANNDLAQAKTDLAVAVEAAEQNRRAAERLERSLNNTNNILAAWQEDRTTLQGVRNAVRSDIKKAMKDESFKAWATVSVPADAWRMLEAARSHGGNATNSTPGSATRGLSGIGNTHERR